MKNVVILNNHPHGSHLDYQRIAASERLRLHVITNQLGAAKIRQSDRAILAGVYVSDDFSLESLIDIAERQVPLDDAVEFVTNNECVISVCGKLRKHYGVSNDDYERFCDKDLMKRRLRGGGLRFPEYVVFDKRRFADARMRYLDELLAKLPLPVFVKPLNGAGSVGTGKFGTRADLERWADAAVDTPHDFEVDEFIEGTLFHCESLLKRGKIIYTQVCEYSRPCFDFTLGVPIGSITLPGDHADSIRLRGFALDVHRHLADGISGVTHLEVFKDHSGGLFFVEIAYRTPGVLASEMYQHRLGLYLPECHVSLQTSEDYRVVPRERSFVARLIYPRVTGVVDALPEVAPASRYQYRWLIRHGDVLTPSSRISQMAGTMLLWNRDFTELNEEFRALADLIPYRVTSEGET